MSCGAQWASFPWLSCSDSHVYSDWEPRWGDSDEAWGLWWKETERDLIGCLHVSGENVDACLPPERYCTDKVICTHTHAPSCVCTRGCYSTQLTVSTFTHSNFNPSQSSQSTRHFVLSGIYICSQKCPSSSLYCDLKIWYHLKKSQLTHSLRVTPSSNYFYTNILEQGSKPKPPTVQSWNKTINTTQQSIYTNVHCWKIT